MNRATYEIITIICCLIVFNILAAPIVPLAAAMAGSIAITVGLTVHWWRENGKL